MSWGRRYTAFFLGLAAVLAFLRPLRGEQATAIPVAKVPDVVRQAANKAVPGAKWTKALKSTEEDETLFELVGQDTKGRDVEVDVTPMGKVLEIETGMPMNEVPKSVLEVAAANAKGIKLEGARSVSQDGMLVAYTFRGKNSSARVVAIRVSKDGKAVAIEVEGA